MKYIIKYVSTDTEGCDVLKEIKVIVVFRSRKQFLNSLFGMCVTDIILPDVNDL